MGGLSLLTLESDIMSYFKRFGYIKSITIKDFQKSKRSCKTLDEDAEFEEQMEAALETSKMTKSAVVDFADQAAVEKILRIEDHWLNNNKIECKKALSISERKNQLNRIMEERRKVFFGSVPADASKDEIRKFFSQYGEIEDIQLIFKKNLNSDICFLLFKQPYIGDELAKQVFQFRPGVYLKCEIALNPQQLHQRKMEEAQKGQEVVDKRVATPETTTDSEPDGFPQLLVLAPKQSMIGHIPERAVEDPSYGKELRKTAESSKTPSPKPEEAGSDKSIVTKRSKLRCSSEVYKHSSDEELIHTQPNTPPKAEASSFLKIKSALAMRAMRRQPANEAGEYLQFPKAKARQEQMAKKQPNRLPPADPADMEEVYAD